MSTNARIEVGLFGDRRSAVVAKNPRNWKVEWRGLPIDSFVPRSHAITAHHAAVEAAKTLEAYAWGHRVLMASLRGVVDSDGAMSTELARWINAKAEGRAYDRNEHIPAGYAVTVARHRIGMVQP